MESIYKKRVFIFTLIILSIFCYISLNLESAEKKERLSRINTRKIKKIAEFISNELKAKEIMTIKYEEITDTKGRRSTRTRLISYELKKQLKNNNIILSDEGVVKVKGVLIRFKDDRNKYRLQIDATMPDGNIITSYTGIIRW